MEDWKTLIKAKIQENLKDVDEKDLRFFRIDEFIRNVDRTSDKWSKCKECASNKILITQISERINEAILDPGKSRREYDKLISKLSVHMRKEHQFFPPYYNTYLFSFIGASLGLIFGYLGYKIYPTPDYIVAIIIFSAALLLGNFIGNKKDKKIRNENRLM